MPDNMKVKFAMATEDGNISSAITEGDVEAGTIIVSKDKKRITVTDEENTPMSLTANATVEEIEVMGTTVGNLTDGQKIPADITVPEFIKMMVQKQVPPVYNQPSVAIAVASGSTATTYEAGTSINTTIRATFNKADAGELTKLEIFKGSSSIGSGTSSPYTSDAQSFVIGDETVTFKATATYGEGDIKNDNFDQPYEEGHILAGSKNSNNLSFNGRRKSFYGTGTGALPEVTSDVVRGLSNSVLNQAAGSVFNITVAVGDQHVIIALPTGKTIKQIMYVETNDTGMLPNFQQSTVQVADARGEANGLMNYNVYTYAMAGAAQAVMTFKVTLN